MTSKSTSKIYQINVTPIQIHPEKPVMDSKPEHEVKYSHVCGHRVKHDVTRSCGCDA